MNVWAEVEKIPIPLNTKSTLDLFFYHKKENYFSLGNDLIVQFARHHDDKPPEYGEKKTVLRFTGTQSIHNQTLFEHICQITVPKEHQGHQISVRIELYDTGDWKSGWSFEGISFLVNARNLKKNFCCPSDQIKVPSSIVQGDVKESNQY
jgi:hypothetical protein